MRKLLLSVIFILSLGSFLYASEFSDSELDKSIEAFSNKNYQEALDIINGILEVEPDNDIALMYKKTIEDVLHADESPEISATGSVVTPMPGSQQSVNGGGTGISEKKEESEEVKELKNIISLASYIGHGSDDMLILENSIKLNLGLPVFQVKLQSGKFDFDIVNMDPNKLPLDKIVDYRNYNLDFGIGVRYIPFTDYIDNSGYLDILVGASDLTVNETVVLPYIGFDTELYLLALLEENIIFSNIWFGGSGYLYNGLDSVNSFRLEIKAGIRASYFKIGTFYSYENIETAGKDLKFYGAVLGFDF